MPCCSRARLASSVRPCSVRTSARSRAIPWRSWFCLGLGVLPSVVAFFAYNQVRFGTPLESGYALATLPPFLEIAA